jgi:four helix bundle protein
MKTNNVLLQKSYAFALRIIALYRFLKEQKEFELSRQILRSGTSIGSNAEEAVGAHSEKDFVARIGISYRESRETKFWLRLLKDSGIIETSLALPLLEDNEELLRIIGSIQKTMKLKTDA